MRLSISRCSKCGRIRLVDNIKGKWICFSCKQKMSPKRASKGSEATAAS